MNETIFSSNEVFQATFKRGLLDLLDQGNLSAFILVCANATFDSHLHDEMTDSLNRLFARLQNEAISALQDGRDIQAVEEDLLVFLKICALGMAQLNPTETRHEGQWQIQFNQLRSFRPKRITNRVPEHLRQPFDEDGFHFNKGFMLKESFWQGMLHGRHASLYYNKYPFVDYHGLLVPERDSCLPQYLTESHHHYLWEISQELALTLDGVGFAYNSLGAFASVNHLHFQMFLKPEGFPVTDAGWSHHGGERAYPTSCQVFADAHAAWNWIHDLHERETPYNLLYLPGRVYVFPRRKQGTYSQPAWTSGFTWHELSGGMIAFSREAYESLDAGAIEKEMAKLSLP